MIDLVSFRKLIVWRPPEVIDTQPVSGRRASASAIFRAASGAARGG